MNEMEASNFAKTRLSRLRYVFSLKRLRASPLLLAVAFLTAVSINAETPSSTPSPSAKAKRDPAEISRNLDAFLQKLATEGSFSGAVLLAKDGKPLFAKAYGLADREAKVPNRLDTRFNLGSMNKMFTAVAIARLAEEGKLSFTDTVGKFLPGYPNADVREKVTIHELLTHTSGLGDFWNDRFEARKDSIRTVNDYLSLFSDLPLESSPGAKFQYSNSGYIVLGAIIEKVSGQTYDDYVREHVFIPAGMKNTDALAKDHLDARTAIGYGQLTDKPATSTTLHRNTDSLPGKGGPAGGGYSTVEDMLRFDLALRSHELLSERTTELLQKGKVAMGPAMQYGYGFGVQMVNGSRIVGHNGGAPGVSAWFDMFLDDGYTLVVLSNMDRGAFPVEKRVVELVTAPDV